MIEKIIHYCWFGHRKVSHRYIDGWKDILPDYRFICWNERNFDIGGNRYVRDAYAAGKFAFVSDYARLYALYRFGGIYLDTDVELVHSVSCFLPNNFFCGFDDSGILSTAVIGSRKGSPLVGELLELYRNLPFAAADSTAFDLMPNSVRLTRFLVEKYGLEPNGSQQFLRDGVCVYPSEVFSPGIYGKQGESTFAVHHFYASWMPLTFRLKSRIRDFIIYLIGGKRALKLKKRFVR